MRYLLRIVNTTMCPTKPKNDDDSDQETLTMEIKESDLDATKTLAQVPGEDPEQALTQEPQIEIKEHTRPSIEVDKKGVPEKDSLKMDIPAFIVKKRYNVRVAYSAKAEATPFTIARTIFFSLILIAGLSLYFHQKKGSTLTKHSKLQSLGLVSELGRKVGLLPPIADDEPTAELNLIKFDSTLKNLRVTMNGQEIQISKNYELFVPLHTSLFILVSAEGIRPHSLEIQFDKLAPFSFKPKYFLANTGTLTLSTDRDVNIVLYLNGELLLEKSSPMVNWPLPEGNYHASLQDDFQKTMKTIDFEIKSGQQSTLAETIAPGN